VTPPSEGDDPGECSDFADNDEDGLFDCDDPDCAGSPDCDVNDLPTAALVRVEPVGAQTLDPLTCVIETASVDLDGDPISYFFSWTVDGVDAEVEGAAVGADRTTRGEVWSCTVVANDGIGDGPGGSGAVTIGNTPPSAPQIVVTPNPPILQNNLDCQIDVPSEDEDLDEVTYLYTWLVNGGPTGYSGESVPWYATSMGDEWVCKVTPNDGVDDGASAEAMTTVQQNAIFHVSNGLYHSCNVHTSALGYSCWGVDDEGVEDFGQVLDAPSISTAQVTAGAYHSCLLSFDTTSVDCWGDNSQDQTIAPGDAFMQIDAGQYHTCGVSFEGDIVCWGSSIAWTELPPTERALEVASGDEFSCARMELGDIECWNASFSGIPAHATSGWMQISAGFDHACAVAWDGSHSCWGSDAEGQVSGAPPGVLFSQVSAGDQTTCGVEEGTGFLHCWGDDSRGLISSAPPGVFDQVEVGSVHSCGVRPNLTVDCWGCQGGTDRGQCSAP
jgi:alpha-tubulin suppressor-like RCC1 family protein